MQKPPATPWFEQSIARFSGHPVVLGLLCIGLVSAVASLIVNIANADTSRLPWSIASVLLIAFAVWSGYRAFRLRRQARPSTDE